MDKKEIDVEQELFDILQHEILIACLQQECPGITDDEIQIILQMPAVKRNVYNAIPIYNILKSLEKDQWWIDYANSI
jgi:hypothetical protein